MWRKVGRKVATVCLGKEPTGAEEDFSGKAGNVRRDALVRRPAGGIGQFESWRISREAEA